MYITLDIGGTNIRISSFRDLDPSALTGKVTLEAAQNQPYDQAIQNIANAVRELSSNGSITGIVVSMSGEINPKRGLIVVSDAYPDWTNKTLAQDLGNIFNCRQAIENDAICAGLGERYFGRGKGYRSMGFIVVGTGVGAVRIHTLHGQTLIYPTEFGHIPIIADGERCVCGQRGCIEAYASGKGLKAFYDEKAEDIASKEAWVLLSQHMTQALINFLTMDYVETFIFGGGLALNQTTFIERLVKNIEMMLMSKISYEPPELQTSELLDSAGSIGGLVLLREDLDIVNMNYR